MAHGSIYRSTIQSEKILALLRAANGSWVPLPEILALGIAQYNARIFELRERGLYIENRTDRVDGIRHSWFRLADSPAVPTREPAKPQPVKSVKSVKSWEQVCAEREEKMRQSEPSFELVP